MIESKTGEESLNRVIDDISNNTETYTADSADTITDINSTTQNNLGINGGKKIVFKLF